MIWSSVDGLEIGYVVKVLTIASYALIGLFDICEPPNTKFEMLCSHMLVGFLSHQID